MIQQTSAKIYLANERGCNENERMRSCCTFNFGRYNQEHKQPFGSLHVWNDDTIAPLQSIKMHIDEDCYIVLVPLVGTIAYQDSVGNDVVINVGQIYIAYSLKGMLAEIKNNYTDELVNFLQVRVAANNCHVHETSAMFNFNLDDYKNRFALMEAAYGKELVENLPFYIGIGKLAGREEIEYAPGKSGNGVFVFVIQGAFEVQHRLLHERDGLALWETDMVEAEALSNDAIVLFLEIPLS